MIQQIRHKFIELNLILRDLFSHQAGLNFREGGDFMAYTGVDGVAILPPPGEGGPAKPGRMGEPGSETPPVGTPPVGFADTLP
jgi:hypothetical protein